MSSPPRSGFLSLPRVAQAFVAAVVLAAAAATTALSLTDADAERDFVLLGVACALAAAGSVFEVFAPKHYHYSIQPNTVFLFWAALLAPPWAIPVVVAVGFAPGWKLLGGAPFKLLFNIANFTLAGLAAHVVADLGGAFDAGPAEDPSAVAVLIGAAVAYVTLNQVLLAGAVASTAGRPLLKELGEGWQLELGLAWTGGALAVLWSHEPAFVALAAGPMLLIYRALWVPMLTHRARTDPKTGLYNSEHFTSELDGTLAEAVKRDSHFAVVMLDLDHLRAVNNRCGHLAGDRLIRGVAEILNDVAGRGGLAGRFGGEEFALLLPEAPLAEACQVAEDVRSRVEEMRLRSEDGAADLRVTVSAGVAAYPEHGTTRTEILNAADGALYDAKLGGRNRVRMALSPRAREVLALDGAELAAARGDEGPLAATEPAPGASVTPLHAADAPPVTPPRADEGLLAMPDLAEPALAGLPADEDPAQGSAPRRRLVPWFAVLLAAATGAIAGVSDPAGVFERPLVFVLLILAFVALDFLRLDVFERANVSPGSIIELVLAFSFGPLGVIAAEGTLLLLCLIRRDNVSRGFFDFGAVSLAGTAAAAVYAGFAPQGPVTVLAVAALGGLAYYVVNVGLLTIVMNFSAAVRPLDAWREGLAWLWPHHLLFGLLAGVFVLSERSAGLYVFGLFAVPIALVWLTQRQYLERSRSSVTELRRSHSELEDANSRLRALLDDNRDLLGRVHRSYLSTITSLARTIEAKDPYTGGHTERVARIALRLAERLGFDEAQLRAVHVGAVIHDIGKIGVPDDILLKQGKLTTGEFAEMRRHPEIASYILADLELPAIVKQMTRSHHERFDGSGYPDRLVGEEIPLAARILTVADALDAMTSDRPYRDAMPLEVACAEIECQAGLQFCPKVVRALRECMREDSTFWGTALVA